MFCGTVRLVDCVTVGTSASSSFCSVIVVDELAPEKKEDKITVRCFPSHNNRTVNSTEKNPLRCYRIPIETGLDLRPSADQGHGSKYQKSHVHLMGVLHVQYGNNPKSAYRVLGRTRILTGSHNAIQRRFFNNENLRHYCYYSNLLCGCCLRLCRFLFLSAACFLARKHLQHLITAMVRPAAKAITTTPRLEQNKWKRWLRL